MEKNVVVVYLGNKIPKYIIKNLYDIQRKIGNNKLHFITNSKLEIPHPYKHQISVFKCSSYSNELMRFNQHTSHPLDFREGFWFKTIARFFAIRDFMSKNQGPLIQIEGDVWISKSFPFESFDNIEDEVAFTMETAKTGSAAILWIKHFAAANLLCSITENLIKSDPLTTDMKILGNIANKKLMKVKILPSIPKDNYVKADDVFSNYLFDPLTYGIYLFGEDPKNNRGKRKVYKEYEHHLIKPSKLEIKIENNDEIFLYNKKQHQEYVLCNLHNHSKDMRLFDQIKQYKIIKKRIVHRKKEEKLEFVFTSFIELFLKWIRHRVKLSKRKLNVRK